MTPEPDVRSTVTLIQEEQRRIDIYFSRRMVDIPPATRELPATRVLMIAPHPDDNLFGPGGTAIKYAEAGIPVHWLTITDGRACTPKPADRERTAAVRVTEERDCTTQMGIEEPIMFGIPEDRLTEPAMSQDAVARLVQELRRLRPDAIYVPYLLEIHPLHRYVTHLTALALQQERNPGTIYSWALGAFVPPSVVVDISAQFERKQQLARCYASQIAERDWSTKELVMLGKQQAAHALNDAEYCETFLAQDDSSFIPEVLGRGLDRPETLGAGIQPMVAEEG
jgi:LmbE family N-acetylglucosaminyl deacetylase